jgi:hypothetical protein
MMVMVVCMLVVLLVPDPGRVGGRQETTKNKRQQNERE